jgi:hypothetical protein
MKAKCKKHPKDMTTEEAISCVFHPEALKHMKKHVEEIATKKRKPKKTNDK